MPTVKRDGAVRNPDGGMSEVSLKPVKGSFSELVCCKRPAVSGRSVLRLDYSAVNLQKRLFTGGEYVKEWETAFRRQKSSRGRFLPQKERYYFTRK